MMILQGKIIEINDISAVLQMMPEEDNHKCAACGLCQTPGGMNFNQRIMLKDNPLLKNAKVGDIAKIEMQIPSKSFLALMVFGLPLGGIILIALAMYMLMQNTGALIGGGTLGFFLGLVVLWHINNKMKVDGSNLKVIEVQSK
jgi:positive regulator of sigma E activity